MAVSSAFTVNHVDAVYGDSAVEPVRSNWVKRYRSSDKCKRSQKKERDWSENKLCLRVQEMHK